MKKTLKRAMTWLGAGVLAFTLPASAAQAATNKVVEIPVNYTNTTWEDDWDTNSRTSADLWELAEPSAYSESYTVSYKLYIPASFIKEQAAINVGTGLSVDDATEDEWKYAGYIECPGMEIHEDVKVVTNWDAEKEQDVPVDYATIEKAGDFYVLDYCAKSGVLNTDGTHADATKAEKVNINLCLSIKGIYVQAEDSAVYLDDVKIVKADGTVLTEKDFTSDKAVAGGYHIAPSNDEGPGQSMKIVKLTDNKALTVKADKATVKVGKKVKIKATATPATKITYTSSNKKVATVNAKGVVTAKKAGKAKITVKANGKSLKVAITVKKK